MTPLICAVLAVACATMRNGSTAPADALTYTALFWVWLGVAALSFLV